MKTLRSWLFMGMAELLLFFLLAAIAPIFINSTLPIIGFLMWLVILVSIGVSVAHVVWRWRDACKARCLFIQAFPDYDYLGVTAFLDRSSTRVANTIEHWHDIQHDPDFRALNMSPLEFLQGTQK